MCLFWNINFHLAAITHLHHPPVSLASAYLTCTLLQTSESEELSLIPCKMQQPSRLQLHVTRATAQSTGWEKTGPLLLLCA